MTTTTKTTEEQPRVKRGFAVPCLKCGELNVYVDLIDVTTFHCGNCDSEYTVTDVVALMQDWRRVLEWINLAPVVGE
jgi:uncharacterized protein (DUF983 family)